MKTVSATSYALALLIASVTLAAAQNSPRAFVIDRAKPYVYITFEHAGPREPIDDDEPAQGIWLRLVNNSALPIEVKTIGTKTKANLILVPDEIITLVTRITPGAKPPGKAPLGYEYSWGGAEVIAPGKDLVFSVPINHVSPYWYMRVPFQFSLPTARRDKQPICYAAFTWEDLPESYRSAVEP